MLQPIKLFLHTGDYKKLFLLFKVELLQVTVNKIEVLSSFYHLFRLNSDNFHLKVQKKGTLVSC